MELFLYLAVAGVVMTAFACLMGYLKHVKRPATAELQRPGCRTTDLGSAVRIPAQRPSFETYLLASRWMELSLQRTSQTFRIGVFSSAFSALRSQRIKAAIEIAQSLGEIESNSRARRRSSLLVRNKLFTALSMGAFPPQRPSIHELIPSGVEVDVGAAKLFIIITGTGFELEVLEGELSVEDLAERLSAPDVGARPLLLLPESSASTTRV